MLLCCSVEDKKTEEKKNIKKKGGRERERGWEGAEIAKQKQEWSPRVIENGKRVKSREWNVNTHGHTEQQPHHTLSPHTRERESINPTLRNRKHQFPPVTCKVVVLYSSPSPHFIPMILYTLSSPNYTTPCALPSHPLPCNFNFPPITPSSSSSPMVNVTLHHQPCPPSPLSLGNNLPIPFIINIKFLTLN